MREGFRDIALSFFRDNTFKAGDPAAKVRAIAVGWMAYLSSLERAVELGCNLFVCHEPLFYAHRDDDPFVFEFEGVVKKRAFIERHGLAVLRCHDVWDRMPSMGIPSAWAGHLGLTDPADQTTFCHVYDIPRTTAGEMATRIAERAAELGESTIQFVGPADKPVERVAIGTGAITPFREMVATLRADLAVCTDDGFVFWRDGAMAIDMAFPVVVVNHAVSEEPGIRRLAAYLRTVFPDIPVHHIAQQCMFRSVSADPT